MADLLSELQSVRRKGGKYVYIICSKNAKHKQRYTFTAAVFFDI